MNPAYLRLLGDSLALRDWTFVVSQTPAAPGFNAQIAPLKARRRAELRLSPHFWALPAAEQRHALVHELLHCHLVSAQLAGCEVLSRKARAVFDLNLEMSVDALADAIAPHLPLPLV